MNVRDVQNLQLPTKTSPAVVYHQMVLGDRRIKVRKIAEDRGYEHVKRTCLSHIKSTFRHEKAVRALGAVLLTVDQKRVRMNISDVLLTQFGRNKSEFWRRLITADETWIHHYTPETKIQSKQ